MEQLSVIIPVYNNIKYLPQCIDSVVKQDFSDMEIILVDDGSTDGSGKVCDEYQKADPRIQVIHQKNGGCMKARWHGLQKSNGKYIGFVDSDDWIDPCMYQTLLSAAREKDCDIVSMGYTVVFDGQREMRMDDSTLSGYFERGKNLDLFLSRMMYDRERKERGAQPSLCTKIIKRKLLMTVFEEADQSITMGEDAAVFYPCCLALKNIYMMKEYQYFYRVHNTSMCRSMKIDTFGKLYSFYRYMQECFCGYREKYDLSGQLKNYVWQFLEQGIEQVFQIRPRRNYLFPYTRIARGSNVILYGAGAVGQSYYDQIMENRYCKIVAWADKKSKDDKKIISPDQIARLEDMKVIIAVKKKETADEIMEELISIGIRKGRLVWESPQEMSVL